MGRAATVRKTAGVLRQGGFPKKKETLSKNNFYIMRAAFLPEKL